MRRGCIVSSLLCVCWVLSACATGIAAVGIGYTIQRNRLPTDDLASVLFNKDCNSVRQEEEGGKWCRDRNQEHSRGPSQPPIWCYRSLGDVACYDRPITEESARLIE